MFTTEKHKRINLVGVAILLGFFIVSCAPTMKKAKKAEGKGFLSDYSMLGAYDAPDLPPEMFINKKANWASYDKIIIEPMTIWRSPGSSIENVPEEELKAISAGFNKAFRRELGKDYTLVDKPVGGLTFKPQQGTMSLRYALTEAKNSNKVMDTITSVVPVGMVIDAGTRLATGTHAFVGTATFEGEFRDARTNELLFAFRSARGGGKWSKGKYQSFGHVKEMADIAAETARGLLADNRRGKFPQPK